MQRHPFIKQVTVYSTLRHVQKIVSDCFHGQRTVPKTLGAAWRLVSAAEDMIEVIVRPKEELLNELHSVRVEIRCKFNNVVGVGPSMTEESIREELGYYLTVEGVNDLLNEHVGQYADVSLIRCDIPVADIIAQTEYLVDKFVVRHARGTRSSGDRTPMDERDQALLLLLGNSVGFASSLWLDHMRRSFHRGCFRVVRRELWEDVFKPMFFRPRRHLSQGSARMATVEAMSPQDHTEAESNSIEPADTRPLTTEHDRAVLLQPQTPPAVHQRGCIDFEGFFTLPVTRPLLKQLETRLCWCLSKNHGKSKQLGLALWALRDGSGSLLASNCFTKEEAIARLIARIPREKITLDLLRDEIMLEHLTDVKFEDPMAEPVPIEGFEISSELSAEVVDMLALIIFHTHTITVEDSRVSGRMVDVVSYRAKSKQGNHFVGDRNMLTVTEYCVDLLISLQNQGLNWRTFLQLKDSSYYTQ